MWSNRWAKSSVVIVDAPLDHLDAFGVDIFGQSRGQQRTDRRDDLAGLDDRAVAGGDRSHQRGEHELEGVVPRSDDQDDSQRLVINPALAGLGDQRRRHALGLGPGPELLAREGQLAGDQGDL